MISRNERNDNIREDNVLLDTNGVCTAEESKTIRHEQSRTNPLHGSAKVEESLLVRVGRETAESSPHAQPAVAKNEDTLVAENVANAARDQNECTDSERVCRNIPGHVSEARCAECGTDGRQWCQRLAHGGLCHQVGDGDDTNEGDLAEQGNLGRVVKHDRMCRCHRGGWCCCSLLRVVAVEL